MSSRPLVTVYSPKGENSGEISLPAVFNSPIRPDVIGSVHTKMAKNKRQPYAVSKKAGHQTSAESWGTGRAVARIPRVPGGGTHRAGQAAFGNMCRGGRMFAPTRIWRRWHVKINLNEKRYAVASAVAASGVASLVFGRGHRIEGINEVPLVVSDEIELLKKTKEAVALLRGVGAYRDVEKVIKSRKIRAGKGKLRNRRYRSRVGPLIVYANDSGVVRAFRNVPGVECVSVFKLNLLQLAPGGHMGRFVIWSASAMRQLDDIFGTYERGSCLKKDYVLGWNIITNSDITRIINSDEVQSVLKAAGPKQTKRGRGIKKNPLKNKSKLLALNPYARVKRDEKVKREKLLKNDKFVSILMGD